MQIRTLHKLCHRRLLEPVIQFTRGTDLRYLENWISVNDARILSQVTPTNVHKLLAYN
jgi:hypothetical protein